MQRIEGRGAAHFLILVVLGMTFAVVPLTIKGNATGKFEERVLMPIHGSILDPEGRVRVGAAQIVLSANKAVFQYIAESLTIWCDLSGANSAPLQIALVMPRGDTGYKRAGIASVEVLAGSQAHSRDVTSLFRSAQWSQATGFKFRMAGLPYC